MPPDGPTLRERVVRTLLVLLREIGVSGGDSPRTIAIKAKLTAESMLPRSSTSEILYD
jgi:hypothetical protein